MEKSVNSQNVRLESPFEGDKKKIKSHSPRNIVALPKVDRYYLNKNIYWVRGSVNSVIHDFNLDVLYWLNYDTTLFLNEILNSPKPRPDEANRVLLSFINAGIITYDKQNSSSGDIETLLVNNEKIKSCYIELTQKCNLKCKHCYNADDNNLKHSLAFSDLIKIIDELVEYGIEKVQFIGGEPLLINKSILLKLIDYASPRFSSITIYTNGTLIDNEFAQELSRYSNVKFSIALYSFIDAEHDRFTGVNGSHKKTLNAIKLLNENNIPSVYTGIIADKLEIGENLELENNFRLDYVRLAGRGSLQLYNKQLLKKRLKTLDSLNYEWSKENIINLSQSRCFSRLLYISSNWDVFPCAMERRLKHGNLKDGKLSNIIKDHILNFSKNNISGCKDCEFRYICFVCPPDSLSGDLHDKPWNCTYDVYRGRWLNIDDYIEQIMAYDETSNHTAIQTGGCRTGM